MTTWPTTAGEPGGVMIDTRRRGVGRRSGLGTEPELVSYCESCTEHPAVYMFGSRFVCHRCMVFMKWWA